MSNSIARKTVLIIDDDKVFSAAVRDYLTRQSVDVVLSHTAADGLAECAKREIAVVLLDEQLPDAEGHTLCPSILKYNEQTKIIFATAYPSLDHAIAALKAGAYDYLKKPFKLAELGHTLELALRTLQLEQIEQVHDLERERESAELVMVGGDGITDTRQLVELAASSDAPVLITGETGTGKTLAAKTIHYKRQGRKGPFISINCASLPESLIEAELFGYERGAFTGAVKAKKGLFEMAEGGTIFLDEIGEMPIHLQSKLLSAIDEKIIRRIGGTMPKRITARIMAATNADLEQMIGGSFRSDLYYRLAVIRLRIPPLRERSADIPALCAHLLGSLTTRSVELANGELERLASYDWPGNVRELRNVLERALLLQKGDEALTPSRFLEKRSSPCALPAAEGAEIKTLVDGEKELISIALAKRSGNLMQTARALGISVTTLKKKIREYGLTAGRQNLTA